MMAIKVIGCAGLVVPTQVTSGVAQAHIATALGLLIALFALFAYNFFRASSPRRSISWNGWGRASWTTFTDHENRTEREGDLPRIPQREERANHDDA